MFLRRSLRPKAEVINDYSQDVSNLFRILQRHYIAFIDMLRYQITSRTEFNRLLETPPNSLTDLERAARYLYLLRTGFGGCPNSRSFGVSRTRPARFDVTKLQGMLEAAHERLTSVVVECLSYSDCIKRYDSKETLFYLDPPYWGREKD